MASSPLKLLVQGKRWSRRRDETRAACRQNERPVELLIRIFTKPAHETRILKQSAAARTQISVTGASTCFLLAIECLVAAGGHALLVVLGGLVVRVDDGVGGHTLGGAGLGPGVDGVLVSGEDGEPAVMGMPGQ